MLFEAGVPLDPLLPSGVDPGETGEAATELITAVLEKEDLL